MKAKNKIVIFPPCGENVAIATKRGANKVLPILPLLPRLTAVLPPRGREMHRGFTLIELLVVVLIIGILAAVAVSQYKRAVLKSQYMQLVVTGHKIYEAQQIYYLTHGEYAQKFIDLDLQFDRIVGNGRELQIWGKYVCTFDNNALYCWLGSWGTSPGFHISFTSSEKKCLFHEGQNQADQFCNNISKDHVRRSWYSNVKFYNL